MAMHAPRPWANASISLSRMQSRPIFEDGSFDLIVSHILLHETSSQAIRNIMKECHRLLKPGGMMLHQEVPQYEGMPPYEAFILDWDTYNNNEPFWGTVHSMDLQKLAEESGFCRKACCSGDDPERPGAGAGTHEEISRRRFWRRWGVVRLWRDQVAGALHDTQGKRQAPDFFWTIPKSIRLWGIVMALAGEVSVLRERLDTVERLAAANGLFAQHDIEAYHPDEDVMA